MCQKPQDSPFFCYILIQKKKKRVEKTFYSGTIISLTSISSLALYLRAGICSTIGIMSHPLCGWKLKLAIAQVAK